MLICYIVYLDYHARSPETYRVVFGGTFLNCLCESFVLTTSSLLSLGCHNNAYMSQLHSLQLTSLYRERLVLLPGFSEMASEIRTLQLPSLIIPGLFIPDKMAYSRPSASGAGSGHADGNPGRYGPPPGLPSPTQSDDALVLPTGGSTPPPPPYPEQSESKTISPDVIHGKAENSAEGFLSPSHSSNPDRHQRIILGHAAGPMSYRPLSQKWTQDRLRTTADTSSEGSEGPKNAVITSRGLGKQRRINRDIVGLLHSMW